MLENQPVVLETRDLSKSFKGFTAVHNVNLQVRRNTIHALIGPNGAGKTTLFNLLTKFLIPSSGSTFFKGENITSSKPPDIARKGLVRSFQISAVFSGLTVLENVRIALQRKHKMDYQFWHSETILHTLNNEAYELLEHVDLARYAENKAAELPYGRKRALEIATTLALDPEVLLLDEPMAGMAQSDISRTAELIQKAAKNRTVLMVEHNLSVVAKISDVITVLRAGQVLDEGSYEHVSSNPLVLEAYMGKKHA
ncbi:MAG: ABC transporter ATP-binding protein [Gammaproteobacteria bacterium]|nr:ABC transporter ATP-binding protein [Gammaproteobacteria bacterium]